MFDLFRVNLIMKLFFTILTFLLSINHAQDRSIIFNTGTPEGTEGHSINWNGSSGNSISNRIYANGNMVLEAMRFYAEPISEQATAQVILHADNAGIPGEELYSWNIDLVAETHGSNSFLILTTDLCIYLYEDNYYWLTLHAGDEESEINWLYSNNSTFTYTTSLDLGITWNNATIGNCGALSVWAEYIYEEEVNDEVVGDLNGDGGTNVLDIVLLTNGILSGITVPNGDINGDGGNNVLDVVALVNMVLGGSSQEQLQTWEYVDINPNSIFYDQMVGPNIFNGNVSVYYFGKAG